MFLQHLEVACRYIKQVHTGTLLGTIVSSPFQRGNLCASTSPRFPMAQVLLRTQRAGARRGGDATGSTNGCMP